MLFYQIAGRWQTDAKLLLKPHSCMMKRSKPIAKLPCGGMPYFKRAQLTQPTREHHALADVFVDLGCANALHVLLPNLAWLLSLREVSRKINPLAVKGREGFSWCHLFSPQRVAASTLDRGSEPSRSRASFAQAWRPSCNSRRLSGLRYFCYSSPSPR